MNLNKYDYITIESGEEGVVIAKIIKDYGLLATPEVLDADSYYAYNMNSKVFDFYRKKLEWTSFARQTNKYGQFINWCRSTATKEQILKRNDIKRSEWIEGKLFLRKYKLLKLNEL